MKTLLITLLIWTSAVKAADSILLVANKNTPLSDYNKICQKNGYICLPLAYKDIAQRQTKNYDLLVETFDLDSKNYTVSFQNQLKQSLKEDDLTLDQIKNLILASEKIAQQIKSSQLTQEIKQLKNLHITLSSLSEEPSDRAIHIAGKMIANNLKNRMLLEPYLEHVKHIEIDYISMTVNGEKKYFLNGDCEHPRYTEFISQLTLQVIPHFPEGCNLSQRYDWGSDLMSTHLSEHKNKYLIGLAALATAWFLKTYEISNDN